MRNLYAQIGENGKVFSVSDLSGEVNHPDMIPITEEQYNNPNMFITSYVNGEFIGFYTELTIDKPTILADGTDTATITATIYNYLDELQADSIEPIIFELDGAKTSPIVPVEGKASITFNTSVVDVYVVRTAIEGYRNGEVEVKAK
jgi:hypothetical protein